MEEEIEESWALAFGKLLGVVAALFISALFVQWGWGMFVTEVFKMNPLTYWQAFGLTVLSHQLIKKG